MTETPLPGSQATARPPLSRFYPYQTNYEVTPGDLMRQWRFREYSGCAEGVTVIARAVWVVIYGGTARGGYKTRSKKTKRGEEKIEWEKFSERERVSERDKKGKRGGWS